MKTKNAVYQYGHLYDELGQRILLAESSRIEIIFNERDVLPNDPYNSELKARSTEEIKQALKKSKYIEGICALKANSIVYFEISAGFKHKKKEHAIYKFQVRLLDDLYLARKEKDKNYSITDCHCIVEKCLSKNLEYFEPIYGKSLNNAYMKTYDFYFRLYGSPTTNARKIFCREPKDVGFLDRMCEKDNEADLEIFK